MSGVLNLVSVGPGFQDLIVPRVETALKSSEVIIAYELYLRWIDTWLEGKEIHTPPLTQERDRALLALEKARGGAKVALISSGDIGIYAMASLVFEEMKEGDNFEVIVIPGITAANACASLLGSPLSHDFATLSLSDLLCPWEWIEQRAKHIAEADLACVLYNVQSANRQQGVYRILSIMLQAKSPQTLCGVVRNAYRPEQDVNIHHLQDLPSLRFDMLTTIVIGNRFTQRKRNFIFTPRGYNDWPVELKPNEKLLPSLALWVFSGTSDGNALANNLQDKGYPVIVSAATQYGQEVATEDCPKVTVWAGDQGVEARKQAFERYQPLAIIDATHPYASLMSEQLINLSQSLSIPYLRYQRPSARSLDTELLCNNPEQAAEQAMTLGRRIFLATGSKDLATFVKAPGANKQEWFVRITPEPELIQRALELKIPRSHLCVMQGPFSSAFNETLWRDWEIDCVVTKDSGEEGGYQSKVAAASALNIPLVVIERPEVVYPLMTSSFEEVFKQLKLWQLPL